MEVKPIHVIGEMELEYLKDSLVKKDLDYRFNIWNWINPRN